MLVIPALEGGIQEDLIFSRPGYTWVQGQPGPRETLPKKEEEEGGEGTARGGHVYT